MIEKLYKKRLFFMDKKPYIETEVWIPVHETPCYYLCVHEDEVQFITHNMEEGETMFDAANRHKVIKRIHKTQSRYAFPTPEEAYNHLLMLKRKQVIHLTRDLDRLKYFLAKENGIEMTQSPLLTLSSTPQNF